MWLRSICVALTIAATVGAAAVPAAAAEENGPAYGPRLEGFDYPAPVRLFKFKSQGNALEMAYLDVAPKQPKARVIPRATLVEFPDDGHAPQIQSLDALHKALLEWLASPERPRTRRPD